MTYLVLIYSFDLIDYSRAPQVHLTTLDWWKDHGGPLGLPELGKAVQLGPVDNNRARYAFGATTKRAALDHLYERGLARHARVLMQQVDHLPEVPSAPTTTETLLKDWRLPPRKGIEPR